MPLKPILAVMLATACYGQSTFEIKLPANVASETFVIRYFLTGAFGGYNGWVEQKNDVRSYRIGTVLQGQPATQIKSILYAPGCALQTLNVELTDAGPHDYEFACRPLPAISVAGKLTKANLLLEKPMEIHVNYVAYWAHEFFGVRDGLITTMRVGEATPDADGQFRVALPDLSQDPIASAKSHPGVFQFWARERTTGNLLAELVPAESKARFGSLRIEPGYPDELVFTPCAVSRTVVHTGFARRSDPNGCGR
jgi:hypothetical protein